ncbi:hypothetical protein [Aquibacillus albus]|uniref:FtsZ-interacting cell division protein ZipA n=1 Tax=Aquibacillus albus TaxID=1168171 RepID=A0ABS2N228_9BACI|nr:hypothetical protein [Aquibacillus albus]MBM7572195.1 FtsZ-interacting cell division protein ZipA [Aquibacillus albus]
MIWIIILGILAIIVVIAVFVEKRGKNKFNKGDLTLEEKTELDEDYIKKGNHHETDDPKKL